MKNKTLPITWIVRCQSYYVRIFEIEDCDYITVDDKETLEHLDHMFNQSIIVFGTYKEYCDYLRSRGYQIKSKDNSTHKEIKQLEKELTSIWKRWKQ